MSLHTEEMIPGGAGQLHIRTWRPSSPPRAVVAICHGLNAHSGYYHWASEQLAAAGFAVYALDLRGRGKSDGERFFVESINDYVADLHTLILLAKAREPGLPVFLYGHSAGGVTSCIYALDHGGELAGLICASFAFQVPVPDFALAVLKGIAHIAPHSQGVALKNEDFSRDPAHVAAMNADPLIAHERQPFQTMAALVHADERLKTDFPKITLPVFIMHGAEDRATRPSGSREFHEHVGAADRTLKIYDARFHDMLNDLDRDEVMSDIRAWIERRI